MLQGWRLQAAEWNSVKRSVAYLLEIQRELLSVSACDAPRGKFSEDGLFINMPMAFLLSPEGNSSLAIWIKKCHHHNKGHDIA